MLKVTTLFEQTTQPRSSGFPQRLGGWTESWYTSSSITLADLAWQTSSRLRAQLLPAGGKIVGARFEPIAPTAGAAQHVYRVFPGIPTNGNDIPNMAMLMSLQTGTTDNVRQFLMRGVPDDIVFGGELSLVGPYRTALLAWLQDLTSWQMRGEDLAQPQRTILRITAAGQVSTAENHGFAAGDRVNITRSHFEVGGQLFSGKFTVMNPITATTFTIAPPLPADTIGGKVRKYLIIYPQMAAGTIDNNVTHATTRRVGRPFEPYIGRKSRR